MLFKSIIHIAFYTDQMEEMIRFYTEKLGGKIKVLTRYKVYLNRDDRPAFQAIAKTDPEKIFNVYIDIAPGQSIELFPKEEKQKPHNAWCEYAEYTHFALLVDDIYKLKNELSKRGLEGDTDISKGPSETYQIWYHDPDGNRFEVMQYTENSYQLKGHIDK